MVEKPHRIPTAGDPEKCGVKWEKGVMEDDRGNVMEVEVVYNLGRLGMLSYMRVSIGMLVCVLVL